MLPNKDDTHNLFAKPDVKARWFRTNDLTKRNHFSDGQVRVRGVSTGEQSRSLVRNLRLSGESESSSEKPTNHDQVRSRTLSYE